VRASGEGPEPIGNPLSVPASSSGAMAKYSFTVDLVFFSDGTTWGPAKTGTARTLREKRRLLSYEHTFSPSLWINVPYTERPPVFPGGLDTHSPVRLLVSRLAMRPWLDPIIWARGNQPHQLA